LLALIAVLAVGGTVAGMVVSDRAGESTRQRVTAAEPPVVGGTVDANNAGAKGGTAADRGAEDAASRSLVPGDASGREALPTTPPPTAPPSTTESRTPSTSTAPTAPPATNAPASPTASATRSASTTASATGASTPSGNEDKVLAVVNEERAAAGCAPVKPDAKLRELARAHSADMAARSYFDHNTPEGLTPWDRADKAGVGNLGAENIARGQKTADAVMRAWMNSPGHRRNILDCSLTTLGVGIQDGASGPWWTQDFGR
jgi:uncharacterized protein YkwD